MSPSPTLPAGRAIDRDPRVAGLYAITPDLADTDRLAALVEAAIDGGARLVQYRNKVADPALLRTQATRLAALCRGRDVPLIVNDHAELALSIADAGLHVGADDADDATALRSLRQRLGPGRLLGVSCYRSIDLAGTAVLAGADYVAFGSVFTSRTKPQAPPAPLALFADARALGVATVGIGGIGGGNIASLAAAGADAAAVIGDLFASGDPGVVRARARALAEAFIAHRILTISSS